MKAAAEFDEHDKERDGVAGELDLAFFNKMDHVYLEMEMDKQIGKCQLLTTRYDIFILTLFCSLFCLWRIGNRFFVYGYTMIQHEGIILSMQLILRQSKYFSIVPWTVACI